MEITRNMLTVTEASDLMGLSESQVMRLVENGSLESVQVAGVVLIHVTMTAGALAVLTARHGVEVIDAPARPRPFLARRRSLASRIRPRLLN